ncbi:hydrogenase nickel incorporation protein HypB [Salinibaculum rarum]|uniref:hydrogenase nickel incorporation protein HypB n=1 Tax=Salinibaculum rarum TaxID=3058903 RepID=UPI00265F63AD|nr:hydrogenase nickel incorporation protein HypB [Salinibaculum sp. KK48]
MTQHVSTPLPHRSPIESLLSGLFDRAAPVARTHRFGHGNDGHDGEASEDDILAQFRQQARDLHERVVHDHGVFVVEFLGATGGGKTTLVERLVERAPDDEHIGVIVGDVAGDDDARRFREHGVSVANVTTGKECHLDANMVEDALNEFDLDALDRLYVENVGNMVCPADFPLGAQARILVVSTTEGDDVVRKHPLLFEACDAAVVNKTDIAEAVGADVATMCEDIAEVAPDMDVFETNARADEGVDALADFLADVRESGHQHAHDHDETQVHDHDETHAHDHAHHD